MPNFFSSCPVPIVHTNGTPRDTLIDNYCAVSDALRVALEALRNTMPHGRDYYPHPVGEDVAAFARKVWEERIEAVEEILDRVQREAADI